MTGIPVTSRVLHECHNPCMICENEKLRTALECAVRALRHAGPVTRNLVAGWLKAHLEGAQDGQFSAEHVCWFTRDGFCVICGKDGGPEVYGP